MRALKIAATGMSAQQMRVEVISNNLSNMSTTGYNARRAEFADLHYQQFARAGTVNASDGTVLPTGVQLGLGVRPAAVSVQLSQGALSATNGDLDIAIEGSGYLEVTMPSGQPAYTRDGALKRNAEGLIVNSEGYPVSPEIVIPDDARSITINGDGEVYAYFELGTQAQLLGQFTMSGFTNPKGLEALGSNLFAETEASGPALQSTPGQDGLGTVRQGYLED
ncbi:MAG: flagellar basal-body rod protein FlgG, partial [Paracoccaceae bacterium]|nr:flagellar basal-body rod protein FlgG [Paracoccaceae bacterium]